MEVIKNKASLTKEDLSLFYDVTASIHAIRDMNEMFGSILHKIKKVFRIEGASLALHDPGRKEFYFIRTVEEERTGAHVRMERMRFPDHLGVAGWVLRENRPAIVQDASRDDRFFQGTDLQENFVTRSMICVPLRTRKRLDRGSLCLKQASRRIYGTG
jgi:GAF domain-containing protein